MQAGCSKPASLFLEFEIISDRLGPLIALCIE